MSDEEQKKIFARNLNRYLTLSNKTQKEVADAIGVIPSTFNTWCQGIALPRMGKVQALADYFGINKTDLIDDKNKKMELAPDFLYILPDGSKVIIECLDLPKREETRELLSHYFSLNKIGQKKVLDNIEDLTKIYAEKKPMQYDPTSSHISMIAENTTSYGLVAAHNDHMDEPGEMEKIQSDLSKLKRPQK